MSWTNSSTSNKQNHYDYEFYLIVDRVFAVNQNTRLDTAGGISTYHIVTDLSKLHKIESKSYTINTSVSELHEAITSPHAVQVCKLESETKEFNISKENDYMIGKSHLGSKGINTAEDAWAKNKQNIKVLKTDIQKADHWHKVIKTQFGSVRQINQELKNFKESIETGYKNDKTKLKMLRGQISDIRWSMMMQEMLAPYEIYTRNSKYSFNTEWRNGKDKYQDFSFQNTYEKYTKDNDHKKGYLIQKLDSEENYFYNPEHKAYLSAYSTYVADIKNGDSTRQARNLASLTYFGSLLKSDMQLAAYALLLNNRPVSTSLTPYLPLALHREIKSAKCVLNIDRILCGVRVKFLVKRQNFIYNKISKLKIIQ